MASKSDAGSKLPVDESWLVVDDVSEINDCELDESVLNSVSSQSDTGSKSPVNDHWIVIDDTSAEINDCELDESVLNPLSSRRERYMNNLFKGMRRLKQKRSDHDHYSSDEQTLSVKRPPGSSVVNAFRKLKLRSNSFADEGKKQSTGGERFAHRCNSTSAMQSSVVTAKHSHIPSKPVTIRSGLTDSLPTPVVSRAPRDQDDSTTLGTSLTAAATAKVYDELKAKDRELAALQMRLEMKDQEGHKHKLNVEKLKKQIEKLTDQRVQQSVTSGQKVEKARKEGEMMMTQLKQQLKEEQTKSKQREQEIEELKREMKNVTQLRLQQDISIDRKLVLMRQEEEKKVLDMQRKLSQEQTKSKRKESEIEELKRKIEKATLQYSQQSISRDQKMKEMTQEGEMKVSEVKQQLKEEQGKLQQKEEEIDKLKSQLEQLQLQVVQLEDDKVESEIELLCALRAAHVAQQSASQQTPSTPTGDDLKTTTIEFADRLCGRLIAQHPVISGLVDDVAKSHEVTVNITLTEDTANLVQATFTGGQTGIDKVKTEVLSLSNQLQFDLETQKKDLSCMLAPLFLSETVADALTEIEELDLVEVSIIAENVGAYLSVDEFRLHLGPKVARKSLYVSDLEHFRKPSVPIPQNFCWKFKERTGKIVTLGQTAQQQLSDFYNSSRSDKTTLNLQGEQFVADVKSLELIKVKTGESFSLYKEVQPPVWSYSFDNKRFIAYTPTDSQAQENLYQYGGLSVTTLTGSERTLDLTKMQQIDLQTGERIAVRRYPAIVQGSVPEFSISIAVRGLGDSLDAAVLAVQRKLESFLYSCTLTSEFMSTVPNEWQEIILVQVYNAARQYCIRIESFGIQDGKLTMQLQGAKEIVDNVQIVLKEYCLKLQHDISSLVLEQKLQIVLAKSYPLEWEPQQGDSELFNVQKGSAEWTDVENLMKKTISSVDMVYLDRIQNCKLWDKYALEKKHMSERNGGDDKVNEMLLFHGTRDTDPREIIVAVRGIDFRYSRRDYRLLWGTGAYFAVNASYSDNYCYVDQTLQLKQLLLVKVLTGSSYSYGTKNDPSLTKPPPLSKGNPLLYDTVNGFTNGSYVYIVYDHDRAYPAYLISYVS